MYILYNYRMLFVYFVNICSFVVLCMNCHLPSVMRTGYEIAVNIASLVGSRKTIYRKHVCKFIINTYCIMYAKRVKKVRGQEEAAF